MKFLFVLLFLLKFEMRLTNGELGAVMIGVTPSVVVMIRAVDCRQDEEPKSRIPDLLGDALLDSSATAAVLERRPSSMVNIHDMMKYVGDSRNSCCPSSIFYIIFSFLGLLSWMDSFMKTRQLQVKIVRDE